MRDVHCCYLMTVMVAQVTKCVSAESKDLGLSPVGNFQIFELFQKFYSFFKDSNNIWYLKETSEERLNIMFSDILHQLQLVSLS